MKSYTDSVLKLEKKTETDYIKVIALLWKIDYEQKIQCIVVDDRSASF